MQHPLPDGARTSAKRAQGGRIAHQQSRFCQQIPVGLLAFMAAAPFMPVGELGMSVALGPAFLAAIRARVFTALKAWSRGDHPAMLASLDVPPEAARPHDTNSLVASPALRPLPAAPRRS